MNIAMGVLAGVWGWFVSPNVDLLVCLPVQEPLPHLFNQMFCRLYLLRALRELYHSALDTLNLPPIRQL